MDDLGWKFWLGLIAVVFAVGLGGIILFLIIGWAWYAWGFLGAFILFGAIAVLLAWIHDRREAKRREQLMA
jgi:Kef-type K+ transport system membrane component KefB